LTEHDPSAAHYRTTRHPVIGIDLGTTTCVAALAGDDDQVIVLPPLAAVVGQDQAGQVTVGRVTAGRRAGGETGAVIAGIKRELGSNRRVRFRGREYQPHELCAYLLIELKRRAEALIGEPVLEAVITVPTTYAEGPRRAITEAAGLAQLTVRRLLEEPVAAAVAVGTERAGTFAIYDLGGGTFDAAIVEAGPDGVTVLGTSGDPRLGGDDFDERVVGYALRQIRERYHVDLSQDDRIRGRIRAEAEIRKRELDVAGTTTLELPRLTATVNASVQLTRRGFEMMIEPDLERTFACMSAAALAAGGVPVDEVLLVGGSTRMPLIRRRLAQHLGLDPARIRSDLDPEELVARGAALVARGLPIVSIEIGPMGLRSANLRLRSEMAAPEPGPAAGSTDPDPPGVLPVPPAETPADFRPAAQQAHDLLAAAAPGALPALRDAYRDFIVAIRAADPDARLHELGVALTAALAARGTPITPGGGAADRCP
jgi:molecular chaperone DnaK